MFEIEKKYKAGHAALPDGLRATGGIYFHSKDDLGEVVEKWLYPDGSLFQQLRGA